MVFTVAGEGSNGDGPFSGLAVLDGSQRSPEARNELSSSSTYVLLPVSTPTLSIVMVHGTFPEVRGWKSEAVIAGSPCNERLVPAGVAR